MNFREMVGLATQSSNLKMAEWSERAIDRVAALGKAGAISPLGEHVFRWLYGGDPYSAVTVQEILVAALYGNLGHRLSTDEALAVARYAMFEFSGGRCRTCEGARVAELANGEIIVCHVCVGSGLAKVTNEARARGMGVDRREYRRMEGPLEMALDWLREADRLTNAAVGRELGRSRAPGVI